MIRVYDKLKNSENTTRLASQTTLYYASELSRSVSIWDRRSMRMGKNVGGCFLDAQIDWQRTMKRDSVDSIFFTHTRPLLGATEMEFEFGQSLPI